jgi:hypothetical protein
MSDTAADATVGPTRVRDIYLLALGLMLAFAALRIGYIGFSRTPISCNMIPALVALGFLAIGTFYTFRRDHPLIATLFNAMGLVQVAFLGAMASAALVFYTGRSFPLADASLAAVDASLGFDWLAVMHWFDRHPLFDAAAQMAYQSILAQPFLVILLLALTRQAERVYAFIVMMVLALVVTSGIALFLPALGPYEFFGVSAADHPHIALITEAKMTAPILWLRAADFSIPMPEVTVGLISFPSYHSATALIYAWAAWRTPYLRWGVICVNSLMLIATPVHGSHYLVDVLAGLAVAAVSIAAICALFAAWGRRRPAPTPLAQLAV